MKNNMNAFRPSPTKPLFAILICILSLLIIIPSARAHDGGILATLTQTIHHLFERPVINIGVQPLNYGHGIKLGVDAVIKTRKHPKKTTHHHHHHHYDEEEKVIEEHVIDHHRSGEAKQSSRPKPRISFELGRPRSGGWMVSSAPKLSRRKKVVSKDVDDDSVEQISFKKKISDEYAKSQPRALEKERNEPYIRASSNYAYNSKSFGKTNVVNTDEEPPVASSGQIADYERRGFHSAGSMNNEEE